MSCELLIYFFVNLSLYQFISHVLSLNCNLSVHVKHDVVIYSGFRFLHLLTHILVLWCLYVIDIKLTYSYIYIYAGIHICTYSWHVCFFGSVHF